MYVIGDEEEERFISITDIFGDDLPSYCSFDEGPTIFESEEECHEYVRCKGLADWCIYKVNLIMVDDHME